MPTRMLPTAPIPVHTAYAVPKGSDLSASAINAKLNTIAIAVAAVGQGFVSPSEYFKPSAQPISSRPAARSAAQALTAFQAPRDACVPDQAIKFVDECGLRGRSLRNCNGSGQAAAFLGICL